MGAIIEKGPQSWQIIQQNNGYGKVELAGRWTTNEKVSDVQIYARVVHEETGESVIPWQPCIHLEDQRWEITISGIPAGGLYRIETCMDHSGTNGFVQWGIRGDMVHHVGVGDLFMIAGQSNAAGYGKDPAYDPPELGVHILRNSGQWDLASHPLNESTNTLHEVNMEHSNPGSSPYLHFGKLLKKNLGYPIGLLQSALGGSPLRLWNPDENGVLYRNMIEIIKSQGGDIKGILWYQGCSDACEDCCGSYLERFRNMVEYTRKDLGLRELPILTIQLNRCLGQASDQENRFWGMVREAQRQAARTIPKVYIVPSLDCGLSDVIHNSSSANLTLGERLARAALNEIYGRETVYRAPDLKKAVLKKDGRVMLYFDNVRMRLDAYWVTAPELPLCIEDQAGIVDITEYEALSEGRFLLTLKRPLQGQAVIHGSYEKNPKFYLPVDMETHLPALAFYRAVIEPEAL